MASEFVLVLLIGSTPPLVVAADDAELIGQTVVDFFDTNPTTPEVQINIKRADRLTPDA